MHFVLFSVEDRLIEDHRRFCEETHWGSLAFPRTPECSDAIAACPEPEVTVGTCRAVPVLFGFFPERCTSFFYYMSIAWLYLNIKIRIFKVYSFCYDSCRTRLKKV